MSVLYYESSIAHHGIKGQKWGIRRYQNSDGSLTPRGQRRYEREQIKIESRKQKRYEQGEKLHGSGMDVKSITEKNQIIMDSVNLGASTLRTILLISGISSTPIAAVGIATVSLGSMAYNTIQKKHTKHQVEAYNEYMSRHDRER